MLLPTRLWLATLVVLASAAAHVQNVVSSFPNRPIRIVVPFAPGGGTDITARILGQKLAESSGNAIPSHLSSALFESAAGVSLTHVPYKGAARLSSISLIITRNVITRGWVTD